MAKKQVAYRCPMPECREVVPDYNMHRFTRLINFKGELILVCKGCGEFYEEHVLKAMKQRLAEDTARETGLSVESIKVLREEREYYEKEDERLIDDEVDIMDSKKARKIFKKKGDQHEEAKPPLQVMTERFMKGLEKERQKKIRVSVPEIVKASADILPILNHNLKKRGVA